MSSIFNSIGKAANSVASAVGLRPTATAAMHEYEEMPPGYNTMTESKMNNSAAPANASANVKKNMTNVPLESAQSGGRRSKRSKRSSKRSKRSSKRSKRSKRSSKRSSRK